MQEWSVSNLYKSQIPVEYLLHKHIVELDFSMKWRLSIYFNLFAIISFELGVYLGHYPHIFVLPLILFCPFYIGTCVKFLNYLNVH